jgi:hypothetical protein
MRTISVGQAVGAGFRLIGREPLAFLAWWAVFLVIGIVPQGLAVAPALAMFKAIAAGANVGSPEILAAQAQTLRYQPLSYLAALLLLATVAPAVYRAVLHPQDRRFLYLRLGAREAWMTISFVAVIIIWFLGILVAMVPIILIGVVAGVAGGGGGGAAVALLLIFPAIGVLVWAMLRLSFAPVMSFADKTFRLPESWALTRGHAGKLFLVALCLFLILLLVEALLFGGAFAAVAAGVPDFGQSIASNPAGIFSRIGPVGLAVAAVLYSLFGAWIYVMWGAAWAEMYRELTFTELDVF